jgi:trigger factor
MADQTQDPKDQDQTADTQPAPEPQAAEETQAEDQGPEYGVEVADAGTLRKKVTVTVPAEKIAAKREELFGELSTSAQVPGFRIGHAPRRLLEKRFGKEVKQDVRNAVLGDSLGQAMEKSGLKTLGEPEFDLEKIELPESGDLVYSFETEVAPEIALPELAGIPVNKPAMEVTDARVDEAIERIRLSNARYEDTDGAAAEHDVVVVAARITGEGIEETSTTATLRVAPGQIEGLPMLDLGEKLAGKKAGDLAELSVKVPDVHPNESWQGKQAKIELTVNQVRKRVLPEINDEYAKAMGYESLADLREMMKTRMSIQVQAEIRRAMRQQVDEYLLAHTEFELPEGAAKRHAARLLQRRYVELLQMGLPREQVEERMTEIQASVAEQARRDMKLYFILDKIAEDNGIDVTEEEINSQVAYMAQQYGQRPEKMRHQLEADGTLQQVAESIRDSKVLEKLLAGAAVTEAAPEPAEESGEAKAKKAKKAKKTAKKAAKKTQKADGDAEAEDGSADEDEPAEE